MAQGIIIKGIAGFYYVNYDNRIFECKMRGKIRNEDFVPMVGDKVMFDIISDGKGIIDKIIQRNNFITRPPVANIDQVIIVFSMVHPRPNFVLIDKLIANIERNDIKVVLCINKVDLDEEKESQRVIDVYRKIGYEVVLTSAKFNSGIEDIKRVLNNKITAFAGNSGVGKSTLINNLLNNIAMETGELSNKIERGKHTTRHVELFELPNSGYILDTPGFSIFELDDFEYDVLKYYFKEFETYNNKCKFRGCNHVNEPNCAVKDAVENNIICHDRYDRYKTIYGQLQSKKQYK